MSQKTQRDKDIDFEETEIKMVLKLKILWF